MYVNTAILMLPLRRSAQFKMFFMKKYVAECIGTAVLVLLGCGSAVFGASNLAIAFSFGLSKAIRK